MSHRHRHRLAFGPVGPRPSWTWVGIPGARELSRDHDVSVFHRFADVAPDAEVVFIVKQLPALTDVARLLERDARLVYLPIDVFERESELDAAAGFLRACAAVLAHAEALIEPLRRRGARHVGLVEHPVRLVLEAMAPRRTAGPVLWTGGLQHLPHLLAWLARHPLAAPVQLMTDLDNPRARTAARALAGRLGVELELAPGAVNGLEAHPYDEARLPRMMRECRAMIDIKGSDFGQLTKPPTKGQQAIASGVPFACDPDGSTAGYLRRRGFEVADPRDPERWFSERYWTQTRSFGLGLRRALTEDRVGDPYRRVVAELLAR